MKKRIIIAIGVTVIAVLIFSVFYSGGRTNKNLIHTTGIVESTEVNLSPKLSGRISGLCCKEGDPVKAGEVAIRLESDDVAASVAQARAGVERAGADLKVSETSIENSKANMASAEADIKSAEAGLEKARLQMEEAKREIERANALYKEDVIPKADLDLKTTNYDTSVSAYDAAKAMLSAVMSKRDVAKSQLNSSINQMSSSKARLRESEAALAYQLAKLDDTVIKAPVSGTVIFKSVEKGETVSPGTTLITIADLNDMWVRVDLEETVIGALRLGDEAIVKTEGSRKSFEGKISEIGRYAEFATQKDVTRGRQDIKTFRVRIKLEDTSGIFKPGMTVDVDIPIKR